MTRYISLLRFTEKGAREIGNSTSRALDFKARAEKAGVRVEAQYWTFGQHDGLLVLSAERGETVLRCLAELTAAGNVRVETTRAFDAGEFAAVTSK